MKSRAELLLQKFKQQGDVINWNNRGELVYRGKEVKGSNMVDLVNDIIRNRKTSTPQGWGYFARGLADMNIPNELIQNSNRRRVIQQYKTQPLATPIPKTQDASEQDWSDEEIYPGEEQTELKRLIFSPTVRKRRNKSTPPGKRASLNDMKKRLGRWSPLPY